MKSKKKTKKVKKSTKKTMKAHNMEAAQVKSKELSWREEVMELEKIRRPLKKNLWCDLLKKVKEFVKKKKAPRF